MSFLGSDSFCKAKTFKEAADVLGTSPSTIIRRFEELIKTMPNGVQLPKVIVIDILPTRRKETIHHYLSQYGLNVKMVVMDMNPTFKAKKNGIPMIIKNQEPCDMYCIKIRLN